MLRSFVIKFRQLVVLSAISVWALSAQAAFVAGVSPAQIRAEIAGQQAAGSDVAAAIQPLAPPSTPLAAATTQTPCSVSCG